MGNVNEKLTNQDDIDFEETDVITPRKPKKNSGEKVMAMFRIVENGDHAVDTTPTATNDKVKQVICTATLVDPRSPTNETTRTPIVYKGIHPSDGTTPQDTKASNRRRNFDPICRLGGQTNVSLRLPSLEEDSNNEQGNLTEDVDNSVEIHKEIHAVASQQNTLEHKGVIGEPASSIASEEYPGHTPTCAKSQHMFSPDRIGHALSKKLANLKMSAMHANNVKKEELEEDLSSDEDEIDTEDKEGAHSDVETLLDSHIKKERLKDVEVHKEREFLRSSMDCLAVSDAERAHLREAHSLCELCKHLCTAIEEEEQEVSASKIPPDTKAKRIAFKKSRLGLAFMFKGKKEKGAAITPTLKSLGYVNKRVCSNSSFVDEDDQMNVVINLDDSTVCVNEMCARVKAEPIYCTISETKPESKQCTDSSGKSVGGFMRKKLASMKKIAIHKDKVQNQKIETDVSEIDGITPPGVGGKCNSDIQGLLDHERTASPAVKNLRDLSSESVHEVVEKIMTTVTEVSSFPENGVRVDREENSKMFIWEVDADQEQGQGSLDQGISTSKIVLNASQDAMCVNGSSNLVCRLSGEYNIDTDAQNKKSASVTRRSSSHDNLRVHTEMNPAGKKRSPSCKKQPKTPKSEGADSFYSNAVKATPSAPKSHHGWSLGSESIGRLLNKKKGSMKLTSDTNEEDGPVIQNECDEDNVTNAHQLEETAIQQNTQNKTENKIKKRMFSFRSRSRSTHLGDKPMTISPMSNSPVQSALVK